jgi:hypothetical protein
MNNKYIEEQRYKYTVIPEARMVVCECTTYINWWNLKNSTYNNVPKWDKNVESVFKNESCPEFTVRAIAKAHPDDVFDETKGKRIAKSKANIKAYRKILTCLNEMLKSVQSVYQNLSEHESDLQLLSVREWFHLGNLAK